jgi:aspartate/methionine/tyrosine aminotransferase
MREQVAVLPRDGFGPSAAGHLRISLTAAESRLAEAGDRLVHCAHSIAG